MEGLRELSKMHLKAAERTDAEVQKFGKRTQHKTQ